MLQFTLIRSESLAVVDNADITVDLSALPTNVDIVAFQGIEGKVEYNDRPELRTPFTDPSPYQPQLNLWMTAFAAAVPALLLSQAKQVKKDLVDSIFHHKRRLPYTYGAWQYDGRDEAVAYGTMLLNGTKTFSSGDLSTSVNAVLATLTNQINAYVVGPADAGSHNGNRLNFGTNLFNCLNQQFIAGDTFMTASTDTYFGVIAFGTNNPSFAIAAMVPMSAIAGATMAPGGATALGYVGNITMQPLNATAPQSIPADTFYQALLGIAQRRNTLNSNRLTKQIAIENLTTIAAVTAYDATAGWSF